MTTPINKKPKIVIIGGPTASGKSSLAVKLAKQFNGEIVGADSMQIYRHMNIGTGKITTSEMCGIKHRLIDILEPTENYSVGQYRKDAEREIDYIISQNKLPIIVGGTGLYINSIISGYSFSNTEKSEEFREKLKQEADEFGIDYLHDKLKKLDINSAQNITKGDLRRIIRALEICEFSGRTKSEQEDKNDCKYDYLLLLVKTDRQELYQNINARVDKMIEKGLIDEVKNLNLNKEYGSMNGIGYKEVLDFFKTEPTNDNFNKLVETIKLNTRHYAKRQITYFKNVFSNSIWIEANELNHINQLILEFLSK